MSDITVNNFNQISLIPYQIVKYLISNGDENLWKLLKYQTIDALDKDNLTLQEKMDLIWNGDTKEENYTIFLKPLIGNSLDTAQEQTRMMLFRYNINPSNLMESILVYEFDIICNEKCANVLKDNMLVERTDEIEALLLNSLNGKDIGIGQFVAFDKNLSRNCQSLMSISNSKSFYGRSLFLGIRLFSPYEKGDCQ